MEAVRKFLAGRGVGYYLSLLAAACGIAAGVLYGCTGVTSFNPDYNMGVFICVWGAVALCAVTVVFDRKEVRYVAAMLFLYGFMWYIYSQVTYIANVFVAIDGYGFTASFLATFLLTFLAFVLALLGGILTNLRPRKEAGAAAEVKDESV